jgi:hypothetical protein
MCNLYSIIKGPQANRDFAHAMRDTTGNLPPIPHVEIGPRPLAPANAIKGGRIVHPPRIDKRRPIGPNAAGVFPRRIPFMDLVLFPGPLRADLGHSRKAGVQDNPAPTRLEITAGSGACLESR